MLSSDDDESSLLDSDDELSSEEDDDEVPSHPEVESDNVLAQSEEEMDVEVRNNQLVEDEEEAVEGDPPPENDKSGFRARAGNKKYGLRANPRPSTRLKVFNTELTLCNGILKGGKRLKPLKTKIRGPRSKYTFASTVNFRTFCKAHASYYFENEGLMGLKHCKEDRSSTQAATLKALKLFPFLGGMSRSEFLYFIETRNRRTRYQHF